MLLSSNVNSPNISTGKYKLSSYIKGLHKKIPCVLLFPSPISCWNKNAMENFILYFCSWNIKESWENATVELSHQKLGMFYWFVYLCTLLWSHRHILVAMAVNQAVRGCIQNLKPKDDLKKIREKFVPGSEKAEEEHIHFMLVRVQ